ncbi:MAG: hypothetical protein R3F62_24505 [Planctomycetota bacterium]
MRKIKTKGLKIKAKASIAVLVTLMVLNSTLDKGSDAGRLGGHLRCDSALAEDVVKKTPLVICRDLDQAVASNYVKRLG